MNISIEKASLKYLDNCAAILKDSKLGMTYFVNKDKQYIGKELLKEGFDHNEIYVALGDDGNCVGFAWIQINGIFHWYPFLHVVVVKQELRGNGIGKQLMSFYEHVCFEEDKSKKAFLMVGDFNTSAIHLYGKLGYKQVGTVPDLYVEGITEYLMMKARK